ncbi:MAG: PorT family protein [Tannerella sp.]|jgi:hypothetical protein|nr:PorT family protein [Tannerella sp.]
MKRKLLFATCVLSAICNTSAANAANEDSIRVFKAGNKRIVLKENDHRQRVDVQVYESGSEQDSVLYEKIFEGHYRDGESRERRKYMAMIDIPMPGWKSKRFDPHWNGFGAGFAGFAGRGDAEDIPLRSSKSGEFNLNLLEKAIPVSNHYRWAVVTGFGIRWTRYRLKGNRHFEEINDYTWLVEAPEDRSYKKSKLGITTLNVPLLLEWQHPKGRLFFSTGIVGSVKTWSSSRIEYTEGREGKKHKEKVDRGMTLRPVTMDILTQVGIRHWGIYVKYSPVSLFERGKGPELYPLSVGFHTFFY